MKRLFSALIVLLACLVATTVAAPDMELVMVQLMHRHGSRSAEPSYNKTEICGATPCGYLNWAGVKMLTNAGSFLRDRYNNDDSVVSEAMFPSEDYDLDIAYSRSTDVLRTLQSAEAFLRGFFPDLSSLYPAIHTMPENDDYLLYTNYAPQYQYFYNYDKPSVRGVCDPTTDRNFPDFGTLAEIGSEVYSQGYCSNYETRSDCARKLFDIAAAWDSIGELTEEATPLLKQNKAALAETARALFANQYRYNTSEKRSVMQGSSAFPVLQEFVKNIKSTIAGTSTYKLFHYSAHDTTLSRVASSMMDTVDDGLLPPFAQTMVFELLHDAAKDAYHVRVLRGHPGQTPDTNFVFAWEDDWQLQCVDAWGNMYDATDNTCPVDDFVRLVDWSAPPPTSMGMCYLDERYQSLRNCPTGGIQTGDKPQTLSDTCKYYRTRCPSYSCENGYMMNSVTLQCVRIDKGGSTGTGGKSAGPDPAGADERMVVAPEQPATSTAEAAKGGVAGGAVAGIALGTLAVGAIISAALTSAICLCRHKRKSYAEVPTV